MLLSHNRSDVSLHWWLRIPMRDGISLAATLYLPAGSPDPGPCIVTLTPYTSDYHHERSRYFAQHGFPALIVDVRGRGNSDGTFRPFLQEASDGFDVVEWVAAQDYCNGKVAMWCSSYLGYNQWATAKELPPHLATIVPTAAPYIGVDFPMRNNIFFPYLIQWLTLTSGRTLQAKTFSDRSFWANIFREWHKSGDPFRSMDKWVGTSSSIFQEWLDHPELDHYWAQYNPSPDQYARLRIPILTITGSYDDDQSGALEHYRMHIRNASPEMRERHFLIIGPWDHGGTHTPALNFGGLSVGPNSLVDISRLHLEWYEWTMKGGDKPAFLRDAVAYYVIGAERWRYARTLEDVTSEYLEYFLDSDGTANDVLRSGILCTECGKGSPDSYVFDPSDTDGEEIEAESIADGRSLIDQSLTFALHGKLLVYHSAPFRTDLEVSGFFKLLVWMSIDCPDTDWYVSVYEIFTDGTCLRLTTDAMRARYRESLFAPKLVDTREPIAYEFNRFTFISRRIVRGSRLRLVIAPMGRLNDGVFVCKNYNAGGTVVDETASVARAVTVTIFHSQMYPSKLLIPVGRSDFE